MRSLALVLLLIFSLSGRAEDALVLLQSLESRIDNSPEEAIKIIRKKLSSPTISMKMSLELEALLSQAYVVTGQLDQSSALAKKITREARASGFEQLVGKGLHRQASIALYQGNLELALDNYQQALSIFEQSKDEKSIAFALMGVGSVYGQQGRFKQALDYYRKSLKFMRTLNDDTALSDLLNNVGSISFWLNDFYGAIDYYQQSIEYAKASGDVSQLSLQYANIGEAYTELKQFEPALENFGIGLKYAEASTSPYSKISIHLPLGKLELKLGNLDTAVNHFESVIELAEQTDAKDWIAEALLGKATAIATTDRGKAVEIASFALALAKDLNKPVFIRDAHKILSKAYTEERDFSSALVHNEQYHLLNYQILEQDGQSEIIRVSGELALEQKNHEIEMLTKDKILQATQVNEQKTKQKIWLVSITLLFFMLLTIYRHYIHKRRAKEQKEIADKLRRLDKLKDQFLANSSHELRTPLNAIIGLSDVIVEDGPENATREEVYGLIKLIKQSGKDLLLLVNDILDLSAINENKLRVRFEPVDLVQMVDKLSLEFRTLKSDKNIKLSSQIENTLPLIKADRKRLHQILLNLLDNAIKYTKEGSVNISAKTLEQSVLISIEDTGIGIPEQHLNSIFNRFEQVDGSSTRQAGGTGLGLAIVKELVELHEGQVQVFSTPGKGSRFEVMLPCWRP